MNGELTQKNLYQRGGHGRGLGSKGPGRTNRPASKRTNGRQEEQDNRGKSRSSVVSGPSAAAVFNALDAITGGGSAAQPNPSQVPGNSSGYNLSNGNPLRPAKGSRKISPVAKRRLITGLQLFIGLGIIAILIMLVLLAGKIKSAQDANHQDTQDATNTIICMLQVPLAQRTPQLAQQCRKDVQAADDAAGPSTTSSSTTTTTAATATVPGSSTTTTTTPTPTTTPETTPTLSVTAPTVPKNCVIDLLGLHLICPQGE